MENKLYLDFSLFMGKPVRRWLKGNFLSEEYQHLAIIHVRLPQSGEIQDVEIELNEFQVQMAIDALYTYKTAENINRTTIQENQDNIVV